MNISAIIRCHNEDTFLKECIGSILNFVDEVVFINNNCTDNSVDIAKQFKIKIVNFNYNVGGDVSCKDYANWCNQQAKCDYLLRWDADMIAYENFAIIRDFYDKNLKTIWYHLVNFHGDHLHTELNALRIPEPYLFHKSLKYQEHKKNLNEELCCPPRTSIHSKYIEIPIAIHFDVKSTKKYLLRKEMNYYRKKRISNMSLLEWTEKKYNLNWVDKLNVIENEILKRVHLYHGNYPKILNEYILNPTYKIIYVHKKPRLRISRENFKFYL